MPRCKTCNDKFTATRFLQKTCSNECEKEYRSDNPVSRIQNKSSKRKIQEAIYIDIRKVFLNKNPECAIDKKHNAVEVHHTNGREGDRLNNVNFFLPVCRKCHVWIHANPKESREKGWLQ
jgi:hypothetical protein